MNSSPKKARQILVEAVKLAPELWQEYLDDNCGDDELKERVHMLLQAHQQAGSFVQLNGAASTDAEQASNTLIYEWDLDGDGIFGETGAAAVRGDETGVTPMFSAAGLDGPTIFAMSSQPFTTASASTLPPHNTPIWPAVRNTFVGNHQPLPELIG